MSERTILVTGGAGHVGSHVIEQLAACHPNDTVISLDNYSNGRASNHIDSPNVEYRTGDVSDVDSLVTERPDLVFHLGEYARIAPSFDEPYKVLHKNMLGALALLEFCHTKDVPKLVYAASSTRFADNNNGRHQNPYSFSKATNVDLINNYYSDWYPSNDRGYAITYFYNAFGPRELGLGKYATVIARFQEENKRGDPHFVSGDGSQKRNFTYVGDIARGMIMVGEQGSGDGYALNNPEATSIIDIARAFGGPVILDPEAYTGRTDSGHAPTRAHELGWTATINVLDWIADFVEKHPHELAREELLAA